jgi:hypothetical protein
MVSSWFHAFCLGFAHRFVLLKPVIGNSHPLAVILENDLPGQSNSL